jgi:polysaccharide export outer membrane protein
LSSSIDVDRRSLRLRPTLLAGLALCAVFFAAAARADVSAARIVAGDTVDVQVWQEPDLSGAFRVEDDGALNHVLLGRVPAEGRTVEELADDLRSRLEQSYLRAPRVVVSLQHSARRTASVLGPVERPGAYPVREPMRVLDLLVAAGGLSEGAGSTAVLLRNGPAAHGVAAAPAESGASGPVELDLKALLRGGDASANPPVAPGDVLIVSRSSAGAASMPDGPMQRVRVVGEVARPGTYALGQAPTLLDAVLLAGGLTEYAAGNRARLVRGDGHARLEERIHLDDLLDGDEDASNVELRDGDLIVVPQAFF